MDGRMDGNDNATGRKEERKNAFTCSSDRATQRRYGDSDSNILHIYKYNIVNATMCFQLYLRIKYGANSQGRKERRKEGKLHTNTHSSKTISVMFH